MKPAHKDSITPPGQIVNEIKVTESFDRYPYIPKRLGDVIDKIKKEDEIFLRGKKKLTFYEWAHSRGGWKTDEEYHAAHEAWKAAQENK